MDDTRLKNLEDSMSRIEASNATIANALLGSLENNSIGLIEQSRNQQRDIDTLKKSQEAMIPQVQECVEFKHDVKKVVIGIAAIVPFIFEAIKLGAAAIYEFFKNHNK
jgi:hypothetical protein